MPNGQLREQVERKPHPGGVAGAHMSGEEVAKRAWASRGDPRLKAWVLQQCRAAGNPTSRAGKVQAIVDGYRARVAYVPDPPKLEMMAGPIQTLCLDDHGLCILGGDCDEATIACMGGTLSIGIEPCYAVMASYAEPLDQPTHIFYGFDDEQGKLVLVDPVSPDPVGVIRPEPARLWVLDPQELLGIAGLPAGEFVGISGPPVPFRRPEVAGGPALRNQGDVMSEWGELSFGGRPVAGYYPARRGNTAPAGLQGLGVWASTVDARIGELDPSMTSLNAAVGACTTMAAADVALWNQAYQRWQKVKSDWAFDKQGSITPGPVYGDQILAQVQLSRNDYVTTQGKVAQACAQLAPPAINPVGPPDENSWADDLKTAGKVIVGITVTGVIVYAVYKVVDVAGSYAKRR
jgi:hypothetical protein